MVLMLVPMTSSGRDRVARWLRDPAVAGWWGNRATAEARIATALATPSAVCRMILLGGAPIGYAQALDAGLDADTEGVALEPGTAECALFIGEAAQRGQGHWGVALDQLAAEVLATTLTVACAIVVPVRHERAVRAAERARFRWSRIVDDPAAGPAWVMLRER